MSEKRTAARNVLWSQMDENMNEWGIVDITVNLISK